RPLVVGKWLVAEQRQPMRMGLAGQQFGRALAGALGTFAAVEAAVVEEELEQGQVVGAEVAPQGKVVPQPTVEVLDQGTGPDRVLGQVLDGLVEVVEPPVELLAEFGRALPTAGVGVTEALQAEQGAARSDGDVKPGGEFGEIAAELGGEAEQLVAMVVEEGAEGAEAALALCGAVAQLGDDEVIQGAAVGRGGAIQ